MAWLTDREITAMGFACVGTNVLLSNKASYYNCQNIRLGNHVRIDDFCVLSAGIGGIEIGNYVHVAVYTSIIGAGEITIDDFILQMYLHGSLFIQVLMTIVVLH